MWSSVVTVYQLGFDFQADSVTESAELIQGDEFERAHLYPVLPETQLLV